MPSLRLTDAAIKRIKPPARGQVSYFDKHVPGLCVRASYAGRKSFEFRYRLDGRQRRLTIGEYGKVSLGDARDEARDMLKAVHRGDDPALLKREQKRARATERKRTFEAVAEQFIEKHAKPNQKSWRETEYHFKKYVNPQWGKLPIAAITRADCIELVERVVTENGRFPAMRVRAHVRKMFSWAVGRDLLQSNPMANVPRPVSAKQAERDRVLTRDEVKSIWNTAGGLGYPNGPFVRMLMLTAQRRSEVARMRWSDVDLKAGVWRLSREQTKAGRAHDVPLSAAALDILQSLPRFVRGDYVFSTTSGIKAISGFSKLKAKLDKESGVEGWRLHDLRRTVATHLEGELGVTRFVVARVLNHSQSDITSVYSKADYLGQKREALDKWAVHLAEIARSEPVPIDKRRQPA